jgi:alpha/beta superfamily hydrolase
MEKISIPVNDAQYVMALLFTPEAEPRGAVVVCHGFRGAKENSGHIYSFAARLTQRGFLVVAFDFRGSGESPGQFCDLTLTGQAGDLEQVCSYIDRCYKLPQLLLGRSFGGSTVIAAAPHITGAIGYILWSAPFDLSSCFRALLGEDYQRLLTGELVRLNDAAGSFNLKPDFLADLNRQDMDRNLAAMAGKPLLVVHGKEDETVACFNAQQIAALCPDATLCLVERADHRFTGRVEVREDITLNWIDTHFGWR